MMMTSAAVSAAAVMGENMKSVLTAAEMKAWDEGTIRDLGIPSAVLMEKAALAIADRVEHYRQSRGLAVEDVTVLAVCGTGNNGGDGAACVRILAMRGYRTALCLTGSEDRFSPDMAAQTAVCRKLGIPEIPPEDFSSYTIIIDAVFGIGLSRPAEDRTGAFRAMAASGAYVISADIPSGVESDHGYVRGAVVKADETVTMQSYKAGHLLYPGAAYCGHISVADIGIRPLPGYAGCVTDASDLSLIPPRRPRSNKGSYGKVLMVAGSRNMCGAALMACEAALRAGCGMVRLVTEEANRVIVQSRLPEVMLETWHNADEAAAAVRKALPWADTAACGPGLGTGEAAEAAVTTLLTESDITLILDADGINCLRGNLSLLRTYRGRCLITPHPGEMARLRGLPIGTILDDLLTCARDTAREAGIFVLLKDARTVTASPDGHYAVNTTGCSGMATAGSGDILTGIAAALAARGTPFDSVGRLAAWVHGQAGRLAAKKHGESGMIATDMIEELSEALMELT